MIQKHAAVLRPNSGLAVLLAYPMFGSLVGVRLRRLLKMEPGACGSYRFVARAKHGGQDAAPPNHAQQAAGNADDRHSCADGCRTFA
jgi:hypothetical protein